MLDIVVAAAQNSTEMKSGSVTSALSHLAGGLFNEISTEIGSTIKRNRVVVKCS